MIKHYKNGITLEVWRSGWIAIYKRNEHDELDHEKYLYYTQRQALKHFKEKYNIK